MILLLILLFHSVLGYRISTFPSFPDERTIRSRFNTELSKTKCSSMRCWMSSQNVLTKELKDACSVALEKLDCVPIFTTFSQSSEFKNSYWQKAPFYCEEHLDNLIQAFTMKDVEYAVETDFLEAGRGTFVEGSGGWNMAMVSQVILFELFDNYY